MERKNRNQTNSKNVIAKTISQFAELGINQIKTAKSMDAYDGLMIKIQIENWDVRNLPPLR